MELKAGDVLLAADKPVIKTMGNSCEGYAEIWAQVGAGDQQLLDCMEYASDADSVVCVFFLTSHL